MSVSKEAEIPFLKPFLAVISSVKCNALYFSDRLLFGNPVKSTE